MYKSMIFRDAFDFCIVYAIKKKKTSQLVVPKFRGKTEKRKPHIMENILGFLAIKIENVSWVVIFPSLPLFTRIFFQIICPSRPQLLLPVGFKF